MGFYASISITEYKYTNLLFSIQIFKGILLFFTVLIMRSYLKCLLNNKPEDESFTFGLDDVEAHFSVLFRLTDNR